jgi:large subunit ribosomal protein L23
MAIFKKTKKEVKAKSGVVAKGDGKFDSSALVRPRITEKAAILAEKGTYVFEVAKDTNKIEIAKAIEAIYHVKPVRVNIVNLPDTRVFVRNKKGVKAGIRKALVTLKKGDKIEIV